MGNCETCNTDKKEVLQQDIIETDPIVYSIKSFDQIPEYKPEPYQEPYKEPTYTKKPSQNMLQSQISQKLRHIGSDNQFDDIQNKEVIRLPDGTDYYGQVKNDMPSGHGKQIWNNGDEFIGFFIAGKRNGVGKFYKKDGYTYHGNFDDNKINGYGVMMFPNGDEYKGNFLKGKYNGEGALSLVDGTVKKGEFRKGKFLG